LIYLKTFKLSNNRNKNSNIYPFNVLKNKEPDVFLFDNITVLYGNNGSGKSTILNIIAHKLNLKGKERNNPKVIGTLDYFEEYASKCEYQLVEDENGKYVIVPSELVDDIREVMNDYTYIKKDYHKIIDMGTKEEIEVGKTEKELTITMG